MIVIAYASKHGSTAGIAEHIAARLRERGSEAQARAADEIADVMAT